MWTLLVGSASLGPEKTPLVYHFLLQPFVVHFFDTSVILYRFLCTTNHRWARGGAGGFVVDPPPAPPWIFFITPPSKKIYDPSPQLQSACSPMLQSKPWIMFAATLQPSWPSRPKTNVTLLFYFLKLYNFGLYDNFCRINQFWASAPMDLKNHDGTKKSQKKKKDFRAQFRSTFNQ